jgi:hypothetical protein
LSGVKTGCLELENQIQLLKQVFFQIKIKFWLFCILMISVSSGIKINFLGNITIEYVCIGKEPYYTMIIVDCLVLISNLIVFGP